jgi:hypothetical protein
MKILFLTNGDAPDYQQDTVLHGLKMLMGDDVVDYRRAWYMYADSFGDGKARLSDLYGKGFTLFGLLPPDTNCDRTDIVEKLQNKFFDLVIYGGIQRNQAYFGGVTATYPPERVVFIDGEDYPQALNIYKYGTYFKRELLGDNWDFLPIHFGVPKEKVVTEIPEKKRFMAEYDPLINRTYIFEDENEYYQGYRDSYFAPTMKKSGWECMRHEEILSQACLPYFRVLDAAPKTVMHRLPRKELLLVMQLIEYGVAGCDTAVDFYHRVIESVMAHVRENLTTESVARYVLDTVKANQK